MINATLNFQTNGTLHKHAKVYVVWTKHITHNAPVH